VFQSVRIPIPKGSPIEMMYPTRSHIGKAIRKNGLAGHEPNEIATNLALASLFPGAYYDVGANVGLFSLLISATFGRRCHAFEPTPELAGALRASVERASLPITIHEVAVSDVPGEATLYLSKTADTSNSLNSTFREHLGEVVVKVVTLDEVVTDRPAIIKIDTETFEPQVLAGAAKIIQLYKPILIVEALPRRAKAMEAILQSLGYVAYQITPDREWPAQNDLAPKDTSVRLWNWVWSPAPLPPSFWRELALYRRFVTRNPGTLLTARLLRWLGAKSAPRARGT
jgi:FkbM family methyltransferase